MTVQITRPGNEWSPKVGEQIDLAPAQGGEYVITYKDKEDILAIVTNMVPSKILGATVTGFAHPNLTFTYK